MYCIVRLVQTSAAAIHCLRKGWNFWSRDRRLAYRNNYNTNSLICRQQKVNPIWKKKNPKYLYGKKEYTYIYIKYVDIIMTSDGSQKRGFTDQIRFAIALYCAYDWVNKKTRLTWCSDDAYNVIRCNCTESRRQFIYLKKIPQYISTFRR